MPRLLLLLLGAGAVLSFAASLYLEAHYLGFLQNHPIMVNLISGVVGFCTASLVVAVGFNWFVRRSNRRSAIRRGVLEDWFSVTSSLSGLSRSLATFGSAKPRDLRHMSALKQDIFRQADAMISTCRRLATALNLEEDATFRGMLADATAGYDQINARRTRDLEPGLEPLLRAYFRRVGDLAYFIQRSVAGRDLNLEVRDPD
ncbi:hypothetical protein [Amycolatopsis vancoresmycina]|uniref:hypothetical protein n=1 Tax=Amycolatopsis vancoresmycina TaxID=208444 RepID=UPI0005264DE4|nr:hypothetical protein [Amycolatopsis vancoresmycina]